MSDGQYRSGRPGIGRNGHDICHDLPSQVAARSAHIFKPLALSSGALITKSTRSLHCSLDQTEPTATPLLC
jgi:hypothetical protein